MSMEARHESVLLVEAIEALALAKNDTVVDATIGGAGHFRSLLEHLGSDGVLIGIDADAEAIGRAREAAREDARTNRPTVHLIEDNFRNLSRILARLDIASVSKALFDLGWSAHHLESGRGFSFRVDEPLLMTYGSPESAPKTAADVVNGLSESELADIIFTFGEERFSRPIAREIVRVRRTKHIVSTQGLVDVVLAATPLWYQHRRIHPATKTFQAFRMYVNDELDALREGLSAALAALTPGGRVAVITFHSIEDRVVKGMFRDAMHAGQGVVLTKKPLAPSSAETIRNPRSRSAKLRVFERSDARDPAPVFGRTVTYA